MIPAQIDTTVAYARSRLARAALRITGQDGPPPEIEVDILNGAHAGCGTCFDLDEFGIGGGDNDDLMLIDDSVSGAPIVVSARKTLLGPVLVVQTEREDVYINGETVTAPAGYERLPCHLTVGDVDMAVRAKSLKPCKAVFSSRTETAIIFALFVTGLVIFSVPWPKQSGDKGPMHLALVAETTANTTAGKPDRDVVIADLKDRLAELELAEYLSVSPGNDGSVVVEGALPSSKLKQWQRLHREIDTAAEPGLIRAHVDRIPDLANLPAIRLVRLGESPELLLSDGRTVAFGDQMAGGWKIEQITPEAVTIARQGETFAVNYQAPKR